MSIDIGAGAEIEGGAGEDWGLTWIDFTNPANDTGTLVTFQVYSYNNQTGFKIGTFYGSGTSYTSRDWGSLGAVLGGSQQTFSGLDCSVTIGDFLGCYESTGFPPLLSTGGSGVGKKAGDQFGTGIQTYTVYANFRTTTYGTDIFVPARFVLWMYNYPAG